MNYMQILARTTHCGVHLNVMISVCLLRIAERRIMLEHVLEWGCRTVFGQYAFVSLGSKFTGV